MKSMMMKKIFDKEVLILIATCLEIGSYGFDIYDSVRQLVSLLVKMPNEPGIREDTLFS